jgi:hypothetical protein
MNSSSQRIGTQETRLLLSDTEARTPTLACSESTIPGVLRAKREPEWRNRTVWRCLRLSDGAAKRELCRISAGHALH